MCYNHSNRRDDEKTKNGRGGDGEREGGKEKASYRSEKLKGSPLAENGDKRWPGLRKAHLRCESVRLSNLNTHKFLSNTARS